MTSTEGLDPSGKSAEKKSPAVSAERFAELHPPPKRKEGRTIGVHWAHLTRLASVCGRQMRRLLSECAARHDLNDTEFLLLWSCREAAGAGLAQHDLAESVGLSSSQISGVLEKLRRHGLADVERSKLDRRRQHWRLTERGERALESVLLQLEPLEQALEQEFAAPPKATCDTLLERLAAATRAACVCALLLSATLCGSGCTRAYYRRQADSQAYALVREKANHPHWPLEDYTIQVDPASRMFDPFSPDRPPMPPDDTTSHRLMHHIDGYRGFPRWHKSGDTPYVENPDWMSYLPLNEEGDLVLDAEKAVLVARLHSRGYQQNLEELYLSALDVSFERFRLDAQFFAGYAVDYVSDGPLRNFSDGSARATAAATNRGDSTSRLSATTFPQQGPRGLNDAVTGRGIQMRKLGTTGTEMVVGLANSIVWNFSGKDTNVTNTLIDFTLFQPLLRRGGRDRVLERLTIAERSLLSNVRQMEHYRRGFYLEIVTGRAAGQGPNRRGGVFGGAGLEGFSGVGGGGFGQVGVATGGLGGAQQGGIATAAGAAQAGGFMGLLQRLQDIRNQEANIAALRSSLAQFTDLAQANRIDYLQAQQARQALYNAQSRLLNTENDYENTLDQYKITLGLPPQLNVRIEDDMLDQFNLIDSEIVPIQNQLTDLQQEVGRTIIEILPADDVDPIDAEATWSAATAARLRKLKEHVARAHAIRRHLVERNLPRAEADIKQLESSLPRRRDDLNRLKGRLPGETDADAAGAILDLARLEKLPATLRADLTAATKRLEDFDASLQALDKALDEILEKGETLDPKELLKQLREKIFAPVPNELTELSSAVLELSLVQARARTDGISLARVDISPEAAFEIARNYRRDWMNARASLVDTWRLVEFNADDLESSLDVVFSGDIANVGNNPVAMRSAAGRLRVGLQFDAPITRVSERNVYRQSILEYQQARRNFYTVGDQIARGLRNSLRTIELNKVNFELRRSAVHVAIEQVELARLRLNEPPAVGAVESGLGATTARDLVSALTDLQNAQNDFLSVWLNYEVLRRTLDQDMGTMRLDERGLWIDPVDIGLEYGYPDLADAPHFPPELLPADAASGAAPLETLPTPEPGNQRGPGLMPIPRPLPPPLPPLPNEDEEAILINPLRKPSLLGAWRDSATKAEAANEESRVSLATHNELPPVRKTLLPSSRLNQRQPSGERSK